MSADHQTGVRKKGGPAGPPVFRCVVDLLLPVVDHLEEEAVEVLAEESSLVNDFHRPAGDDEGRVPDVVEDFDCCRAAIEEEELLDSHERERLEVVVETIDVVETVEPVAIVEYVRVVELRTNEATTLVLLGVLIVLLRCVHRVNLTGGDGAGIVENLKLLGELVVLLRELVLLVLHLRLVDFLAMLLPEVLELVVDLVPHLPPQLQLLVEVLEVLRLGELDGVLACHVDPFLSRNWEALCLPC